MTESDDAYFWRLRASIMREIRDDTFERAQAVARLARYGREFWCDRWLEEFEIDPCRARFWRYLVTSGRIGDDR